MGYFPAKKIELQEVKSLPEARGIRTDRVRTKAVRQGGERQSWTWRQDSLVELGGRSAGGHRAQAKHKDLNQSRGR